MANEQELERLVVRLTGDGSSYMKMMDQAEKSANKMADSVEAKTMRIRAFRDSLHGHAGALLTTITGLAGGLGFLNQITSGVRLAADAEKMESSFKVMLGSAEKATKLMADLQQFAAETPLEMTDLAQFSKMLLQAGVPASRMTDTLRMLGDVAMGDREKMHGLAYAFQQVKTVGRLMGGELIQMMNAGFNPLKEMSRTTGKTMAQLRGEMEKGLITFDMLENAFKTASGPGGQFFNGMKEASTTLGGLFSTMMDDFNSFQREIGKNIIQVMHLKEVVAGASAVFQWLSGLVKAMPDWLKRVIIIGGGLLLLIGAIGIVGPAVAAAFTMAWGAVSATFAAIASVGWPLLALFAALIVIGTAIVQKFGGLEAVFNSTAKAAQDFWEWVKPIRQAIESLFKTIVEIALAGWNAFVGAVSWAVDRTMEIIGGVWSWFGETTGITFDGVRDTIRDAFLYMEFILKNFQLFSETVWAGIKYYAIFALNTILKNIFAILAGPLLLPIFLAMQVNWQELWTNLVVIGVTAISELLKMFADFPAQMAIALATGSFNLSDFLTSTMAKLATAFGGVKFTLKGVEIPALQKLEDQLKEEFEAKKSQLNETWEEFRKRKLEEFEANPPGGDPEQKGEDEGKKLVSGLAKGLKGGEDVLFNSADALARRFEYIDKMRERNSAMTVKGDMGAVTGSQLGQRDTMERKQTDLLDKIAINTAKTANQPPVTIEGAGL